MCPGCKLEVLREMDRVDSIRGEQVKRLLMENKKLWEVNQALEAQRAALLEALANSRVDVGVCDEQTLSLF